MLSATQCSSQADTGSCSVLSTFRPHQYSGITLGSDLFVGFLDACRCRVTLGVCLINMEKNTVPLCLERLKPECTPGQV